MVAARCPSFARALLAWLARMQRQHGCSARDPLPCFVISCHACSTNIAAMHVVPPHADPTVLEVCGLLPNDRLWQASGAPTTLLNHCCCFCLLELVYLPAIGTEEFAGAVLPAMPQLACRAAQCMAAFAAQVTAIITEFPFETVWPHRSTRCGRLPLPSLGWAASDSGAAAPTQPVPRLSAPHAPTGHLRFTHHTQHNLHNRGPPSETV